MFAAVYVYGPQGRKGGIESLTYGQVFHFYLIIYLILFFNSFFILLLPAQHKDLLEKGSAVTDTFKTYSKFGYQVVIVSKELKQVLDAYIYYIRPHAFNAINKCNDKDPLWIGYNGNRVDDIGPCKYIFTSLYITIILIYFTFI